METSYFMRRILNIALLSLVVAPHAMAQAPGRVQTSTRLVTIFSKLENQLADAVVNNDASAASSMVTEDFSEWTPQPPGSPVPRDEWLKDAGKDLANFHIRQMAAVDLGNHVAVNFVLTAGPKAFFVVDIWAKTGPDWHLRQRYLSSVPAARYANEARPTGKN
jgi:hypothetical protein